MNIQPYRRFQTRRACREWVNAVAETEISEGDGRLDGASYFVVMGCDEYTSAGYAWLNPNDKYDAAIGERIARGRACAALAAIIWQADTAQAIHKAQAEREAEWAKSVSALDEFVARYKTEAALTTESLDRAIQQLRDNLRNAGKL